MSRATRTHVARASAEPARSSADPAAAERGPASQDARSLPLNPWWSRIATGAAGIASRPPIVQAKSTAPAPADASEREADDVADRVLSMPAPSVARAARRGDDERSCESCSTGARVQRKALPQAESSTDRGGGSINGLHAGRPLPRSEREFFEPRFGMDLGHVRLHTTPDAGRAAGDLGARAFTYGRHIAFADGEFRDGTRRTRHLLAHELVHTIQQGAAPPLKPLKKTGDAVHVSRGAAPRVARQKYPAVHADILKELIAQRTLKKAVITDSWPKIEELFWSVADKTELLVRLQASDAMATYFRMNLAVTVQHTLMRILRTGTGAVTVGSDPTKLRDAKKAEIKALSAYTSLPVDDKQNADDIIVAAEASKEGLFYMFMLKALLETPSATSSSTSAANTATTSAASTAAQTKAATRTAAEKGSEEAKAAAVKSSNWRRRESKFGADSAGNKAKFRVDASDPKDIVVQIRIFVKAGADVQWRDKIVGMEDEMEKRASVMAKSGYVVDVVFLTADEAGALFIDVSDTDAWANAGNWLGADLDALVHELHHGLGLDDRYDYVLDHARNVHMSMSLRLHWFKVQVKKAATEMGGTGDVDRNVSVMGYGTKLTPDDVCRVAGLGAACRTARK